MTLREAWLMLGASAATWALQAVARPYPALFEGGCFAIAAAFAFAVPWRGWFGTAHALVADNTAAFKRARVAIRK